MVRPPVALVSMRTVSPEPRPPIVILPAKIVSPERYEGECMATFSHMATVFMHPDGASNIVGFIIGNPPLGYLMSEYEKYMMFYDEKHPDAYPKIYIP